MEGWGGWSRKYCRSRGTEAATYVYAFVRETWWNGGAFFFGFGEEDGEFLNGGHGNVTAVVAGEEGLQCYC